MSRFDDRDESATNQWISQSSGLAFFDHAIVAALFIVAPLVNRLMLPSEADSREFKVAVSEAFMQAVLAGPVHLSC